MRAVIMAGGRGERLRPLTDTCPKPLLPVAGRPVLDRLLEKLAEAGIEDVTLAVGYLAYMIADYVGDGARWGVRAEYVYQEQPMGTAGALSLIAPQDCIVVNGDKVFEYAADIRNMAKPSPLTPQFVVGTLKYQYRVPHGVIAWDRDCERYFWDEKPLQECEIAAGIYRLGPKVLMYTKPVMEMPEFMDICADHCGGPGKLRMSGYVLDIGTPQSYQDANERLSSRG